MKAPVVSLAAWRLAHPCRGSQWVFRHAFNPVELIRAWWRFWGWPV